MTIPKKYQVLDWDVTIDSKEAERLQTYISGWKQLAPVIATINQPDLMRLIVMELMGKQRRKLLGRLLGRLDRVRRKRIEGRIARCLKS